MQRPSVIRWLFADRGTGSLVVGQRPNLLMQLVVAAAAGRLVFGRSNAGPALRRAQGAAVALWAADEALRGVNPFRRIGGAVLLAALAWKGFP